jgi:hypothetical protein
MATTITEFPTTTPPSQFSIVEQVQQASQKQNRLATIGGMLLGALAPISTFWIGHHEFTMKPADSAAVLHNVAAVLIVAGGLAFSAKSVFDWAKIAFRHPVKALGFVMMAEGVMTFSNTPWLTYAALAYLVAINGIANGCNLALDKKHSKAARRKAKG